LCSRWGLCIHPPGGGDDRILSPETNLCVHVGSGHSSLLFSVDKQQICTWLSVRIHTRIYISCDFVVHNFVHHNYFGAFRCSLAFVCSYVVTLVTVLAHLFILHVFLIYIFIPCVTYSTSSLTPHVLTRNCHPRMLCAVPASSNKGR